MAWQNTLYTIPLLLVAFGSAALAFYLWRYRSALEAKPFALLMLTSAWCSFCYALELAASALPSKIFWAKAQYLGNAALPVAWLGFALHYTQREKWLTRRNIALTCIIPLLTLLLAWTNEAHGLIWSKAWLEGYGRFSLLRLSHGAWFWVHTAYAYLLAFLGIALLVEGLVRSPQPYRAQLAAVLASAALPWAANILYLTGKVPFAPLDVTVFAFTLSGLLLAIGLLRLRLFDLLPLARQEMLARMDEAVLVLDGQERVLNVNPAAEKLLGQQAAALIGQPLEQALSVYPHLAKRCQGVNEAHEEVTVGEGEQLRWFDLNISPLPKRPRRTLGRLVTLHEITARKYAEAARASTQLLQKVLYSLPDALFILDTEARILDCNPAATKMFGYSREEMLGRTTLFLHVDEAALAQFRQHLYAAVEKEGLLRGFEFHMKRKDGSVFPTEHSVVPLLDEQGKCSGWVSVVHDLSTRKQAEEALRHSEEEKALILDNMSEFVSYLDREHKLLWANRAALAAAGLSLAEVVGRRCYEAWHGRSQPCPGCPALLAWQTGQAQEKEMATAEGRAWFVRAAPLRDAEGRPSGVVEVARDITVRRRALRELQQRTRQLEALYDTALDVVSQQDLGQLLNAIAQRASELLQGISTLVYLWWPERKELECVASYNAPQSYLGKVLQRGEGLAGKVLQSGKPIAVDDYQAWPGRSPQFEGEAIGAVLGVPIKWGERIWGVIDMQRPAGTVFSEEDIRLLTLFASFAAIALENTELYAQTRRRLWELEKLHEASMSLLSTMDLQERLQLIIDAAVKAVPAAQKGSVHIWDEQRQELVLAASHGFSRELMEAAHFKAGEGYAGWVFAHRQPALIDDVRADPRTVRIDLPEAGEQKSAICAPLMAEGRAIGVITLDNLTSYGAFGEEDLRTLSAFANQAAIAIEHARLYQAMQQELAERRRAEEERQKVEAQLRQAQKMEAVALLAGGVAHEFNNLLTVILGHTELALAQLGPSQPGYKELSTIEKVGRRAALLTRQLLSFSRRQVLQPQALDLSALVADVGKTVEPLIGEHIELRLKLEKVQPVFADPGAIQQALMNLVLNARDAMPQGGLLTIETAQATVDGERCRLHPTAKPGQYVRLSVIDTGIGMDEQVKAHIFEPFFTTKEAGKGTGLGLSVVYGIVTQHNGFVEFDSQPNQGARFDLYLPVHSVEEGLEKGRGVEPAMEGRGTETILLAEDEEPVREITQAMLEKLGYKVLVAADGAQAVEVFQANQGRIDLVVLDAVMPKLSGQEAYKAMSALRPDLPVLFITGYAEDIMSLPLSAQLRWHLLQKPFATAQLGRKVRELLDARRSSA